MFELAVEGTFSAAHQVRGYPGDCAGLHGHTYRVCVKVRVKKLNTLGMGMDFRRLKRTLNRLTMKFDHTNLNQLSFFKKHNATAEWVAVFIYKEMKKQMKSVASVTVWEGTDSSATFIDDEA